MSTGDHVQMGRRCEWSWLSEPGGGHVAPDGTAPEAASFQCTPPPTARLQGLVSPSSRAAVLESRPRAPGERVSDPRLGRAALGGPVCCPWPGKPWAWARWVWMVASHSPRGPSYQQQCRPQALVRPAVPETSAAHVWPWGCVRGGCAVPGPNRGAGGSARFRGSRALQPRPARGVARAERGEAVPAPRQVANISPLLGGILV